MNIREDLKAYIDGELPLKRAREVKAAIDADPQLQQELEQMKMLSSEIQAISGELHSLGKDKVRGLVTRPARPWWHPYSGQGRYVWSAACFVLLALITVPILSAGSSASLRGLSFASGSAEMDSVAADASLKKESAESPARDAEMEKSPADADERFKRPRPEEGAQPQPRSQWGGGAGGSSLQDGYADSGLNAKQQQEDPTLNEPRSTANNRTQPSTNSQIATNSLPVDSNGIVTTDQAKRDRQPDLKESQNMATPKSDPSRMVIKNGSIGLRVESVVAAKEEVEKAATSYGGYVENSQVSTVPGQLPTAQISIRVRSTMFDQAMSQLRKLGEVTGENTNGQDVTTQYADTVGRIKVLKAEEDSYVTMLRGAKKIGEIMEIKDRLSQVRQELESLNSTKLALKDLSTLSSIAVSLEQKPKPGDATKPEEKSEDAWANAVNGLMSVLRFLRDAVIYIFVYSPIWIPPVLLFWWLGKKAKKLS